MIKTITTYLGSAEDAMYELGKENGLAGIALDKFMYALYKVKVKLEVDTETGKYKIIAFTG